MLMSGNPDNNNSSSCSLKMAISLDKENKFIKLLSRVIHLLGMMS